MAMQKPEDERSATRPRRFQYSVLAMFGLTTAVAIACAIFFAMPAWVGGLTTACVIISMPALMTILVVYGRGNTRAFGIGALFPASACLFLSVSDYGYAILGRMLEDIIVDNEPRIGFLIVLNVYFAIVLGNGYLAVWMRRWLESSQRPRGPRSSGSSQRLYPTDEEAHADRPRSEES
jgi:hypothetical protein